MDYFCFKYDRQFTRIVVWVLFNESWGVPNLVEAPAHRNYVQALYFLTKTLDPTRPIIGNDGWESIDPVINIIANPDKPEDRELAEGYRLSQYQAWDMLAGRFRPDLGGQEKYLDIIGVNYYDRNQWIHNEEPMKYTHPLYRPFSEILQEVFDRYGRPLFVAETGTEDDFRPVWFNYVCTEVAAALKAGVPIEGVCLYAIVNHPGWDDDRHCYNGLWDYCNELGDREIYQPLADELQFQRQQIEPLLKPRD